MKAILIPLAAAAALLTNLPAGAQTKTASAADCVRQADAQKLGGAQRTAFMSKCLGATGAAAKANPEHTRLQRCRQEADRRRLEGASRESFFSNCQN